MDIGDIRRDPKIPEEVKDLIIPLIQKLHSLEKQIAASIELALK